MKEQKNSIIRGALFLGVGTFIAKLLGAIYRVPLTNLIGSFGLGLYQMIFPVYALLLDFSGAGVPSAMSKIISSYQGEDKREYARGYLRSSVRLLLFFGFLASSLMAIFAKPLATLQGNADAYLGYLFLAPAIFFVSLISCFRGYFQGLMKMTPTATSQIIEQAVKLLFGLLFAFLLMPNVPFAVAGTAFAITLSEIVALIQLYLLYRKDLRQNPIKYNVQKTNFFAHSKNIIKTTAPITIIGVMMPISHVIDSFLVVNLLSSYRSDATSLFGLLSGVVHTIINLPVAICYGIATVAIPAVSGSRTEKDSNGNATKTIILTLAIALPSALFVGFFSPFIINLLFGTLLEGQKLIAVNLLRLTSPCIVLSALVQTSNAVLIGKGKLYRPILSMAVGILVKTILNVILLKIPQINIYGGAIASIACYFTICLINLIVVYKLRVNNANKKTFSRGYAS